MSVMRVENFVQEATEIDPFADCGGTGKWWDFSPEFVWWFDA